MVASVEGWAVVYNGKLDLRTVMPHRRGAIVNWLALVRGLPILDRLTDAEIETLWEQNCSGALAVRVRVEQIAEP